MFVDLKVHIYKRFLIILVALLNYLLTLTLRIPCLFVVLKTSYLWRWGLCWKRPIPSPLKKFHSHLLLQNAISTYSFGSSFLHTVNTFVISSNSTMFKSLLHNSQNHRQQRTRPRHHHQHAIPNLSPLKSKGNPPPMSRLAKPSY